MGNTWAHDLGFYWSFSEAQKGAEDKRQIKALLGGMPMTCGVMEKGKYLGSFE